MAVKQQQTFKRSYTYLRTSQNSIISRSAKTIEGKVNIFKKKKKNVLNTDMSRNLMYWISYFTVLIFTEDLICNHLPGTAKIKGCFLCKPSLPFIQKAPCWNG